MPSDLDTLMERTIGGLKIAPVSEHPPFINMLIYGEPGAGKTVLAGSADAVAEMSPVLVADVEGGAFSLRAFYPKVDVVRVTSIMDLANILEALKAGESEYKTVVLDSLTEIQKMVMSVIMQQVVIEDPERDPDIPSIREWGKNSEQIRKIVRRFRDLPMNVIFTALLDSDKDPKTNKVKHYPSLPGKLKREIPGFVDIVAFLYNKDVQLEGDDEARDHRLLLTKSTESHICKDRSNNLEPVMADPDMISIHRAVLGDVD
jgi:hypothetical protein